MSGEKDAFYLLRKGDIIGVYNSLSDCQAEIQASVFDRPVSVYKGHGLLEDARNHLLSCGLHNPTYCISSSDMKDGLFGELVPCTLEPPVSWNGEEPDKVFPQKRSRIQTDTQDRSSVLKFDGASKGNPGPAGAGAMLYDANGSLSCILKFDGASKGNPGPAGAGAVLYDANGSLMYEWAEGVGIATNNVAEYRGLLLGLKKAFEKGFRRAKIHGDSTLVCMQVQGKWKLKNKNMADLCSEVKDILTKFDSFDISYIPREANSEADNMANSAIFFKDGEVCEEQHSHYY